MRRSHFIPALLAVPLLALGMAGLAQAQVDTGTTDVTYNSPTGVVTQTLPDTSITLTNVVEASNTGIPSGRRIRVAPLFDPIMNFNITQVNHTSLAWTSFSFLLSPENPAEPDPPGFLTSPFPSSENRFSTTSFTASPVPVGNITNLTFSDPNAALGPVQPGQSFTAHFSIHAPATPFNLDFSSVNVAPNSNAVPEPGTLALAAFGLLPLLGWIRSRKSA